VERQHFAGAGIFRPGSGYVNSYKNVTKKPKFFKLKFEVECKNTNFVAIYFKEPFDDHLCLQKHENLLKP
jgi:hypothetical protein